MGKIKTGIALLFLMLIIQVISANPVDLKFSHLNKAEGLSNQTVNSILKDSRGFMWFGTYDGLNLYDGYNIRVFRKILNDSTSLSNNIVNHVFEDSKGRIWLGTMGGGLNLYNPENNSFRSWVYDPDEPKSISSDNVFCVVEDNDGFLWIGTGSGINKFIEKDNAFERYGTDAFNPNSLPHDYVTDLVFDNTSRLWIATYGGGVSILNIYTGQFTNIKKGPGGTNDNEIWDLHIDHKQQVWIGTANGGLNYYNPKTKEFKVYTDLPKQFNYLKNTNVVSINEDNENNIWFATDRGGLYQFYEGEIIAHMHDPTRKESMSSNALTRIYFDEHNVLWVGTYDQGINKANLDQIKFQHIRNDFVNPNSLSDNNVNAIYQDNIGDIYIGTEKGLNITDENFENFKLYLAEGKENNHPNDNVCLTIIKPHNDELWFGGYTGGINILDLPTQKFRYFIKNDEESLSLSSNFIRCLYQDSRGTIWAGTVRGGMCKYLPQKKGFKNYPYQWEDSTYLNSTNVMDIIDDGKFLYIATYGGGLNILDLDTEKVSYFTYNEKDSLTISDNLAITLHFDSKGSLWIGTINGLNRFDLKKKKFIRYYQHHGLPNNSIMGILEDDAANLWISTIDGLSKMNIETGSFENYFKENGLQDNSFIYNSCAKLKNGRLAFGGVNGLSVFYPSQINSHLNIPKVYFTGLKVFNKEVSVSHGDNAILKESIFTADNIHLTHKHALFSIEFSTLTYYSARQIHFEYRLSENEKWIHLGSRNHISFHNLNPGVYNLTVRAKSNDGKIYGKPSSIRLEIKPPFYKNWVTYVLLGFFLGLLGMSYYLYRIRSIKTQGKKLEKMVFEKTMELQEANGLLQDHQAELEMQNEEISSQRDLAENQRKRIEKQHKELELHRNHLEQLIVERTRDLIEAKEKAEESDRLKSSFLANMSHEIRTPMNAILGFIQLLDDDDNLPSEREMYKELINQSGEKLLALITDLIDLAKIESNQLTITKSQFNLNGLLKNLYLLFVNHQKTHANKVVLTLSQSNLSDEFIITTDNNRLNQILTNLIDNAIKFTENGGVSFGYTYTPTHVKLFVQDEGIGIPEKDFKNIFNRFRKIEENKQKLYRGTGLGLAICKELTALLDGEILVSSELGKGTRFSVILPRE
jgi:signal transduction histidine kinase/streptogramin lyase